MNLVALPQLTEAMIAEWKSSPEYSAARVRPESAVVWHITRPDGAHAWFTDNPIEAAYFSPPWHCDHKVVQWGPSQPLLNAKAIVQPDEDQTLCIFHWDSDMGEAIALARNAQEAREMVQATLLPQDAAYGDLKKILAVEPVVVTKRKAVMAWCQG